MLKIAPRKQRSKTTGDHIGPQSAHQRIADEADRYLMERYDKRYCRVALTVNTDVPELVGLLPVA